MTREDAIKKYMAAAYAEKPRTQNQRDGIRAQVASRIDGLAALGLLKLDEPKTVEDRAHDALHNLTGSLMASEVLFILRDAGLKIVEADK